MYKIEKTIGFEASHQLPNHDGKCRRLHGHSWKMTVYVVGDSLVEDGAKKAMLVDFGDISRVVKGLVDAYLDHYHLNESTGLDNPTSEALSEWVFNRLEPQIRTLRGFNPNTETPYLALAGVRIEETCTSACTYYPDKLINNASRKEINPRARVPNSGIAVTLSPGTKPSRKQ